MTKKCSSCGYENTDDAEYCESCGLKLTFIPPSPSPKLVQPQQPSGPSQSAPPPIPAAGAGEINPPPVVKIKCPQCGYENDPRNEFCEKCGYKLSGAAVSPISTPIAKLILPQGNEIQITSFPATFGRSNFAQADKSEYISRKHFEITFEGGKFYIVDTNSTNGTTVNGTKISSKTEIKDGDTIELATILPLTFKVNLRNEP